MNRPTYYKRMFLVSALFNFIVATMLLAGLTDSIVGATPFDPLGKQLFGGFVVVFGIGYWIVSRDIRRNEGIVWLGIIGKLLVVVLFFAHAIGGGISYRLAAPSLIDFGFAILFAEFLVNGRQAA